MKHPQRRTSKPLTAPLWATKPLKFGPESYRFPEDTCSEAEAEEGIEEEGGKLTLEYYSYFLNKYSQFCYGCRFCANDDDLLGSSVLDLVDMQGNGAHEHF
jgi:hypothetical protein